MTSHPVSINDSNTLNICFAMYDNMSQVNFRMSDDEKLVITALAKQKGISVAELARQALINEIMPMRVNLAFDLLNASGFDPYSLTSSPSLNPSPSVSGKLGSVP